MENMTTAIKKVKDQFQNILEWSQNLLSLIMEKVLQGWCSNFFDNNSEPYFSALSKPKASIKTFYKTLRTMMLKYLFKSGKKRCVDVLDHLVNNNNHRKHSIPMALAHVKKSEEKETWKTLYAPAPIGDFPKLKVGDFIQILAYKNIFQKGYNANFMNKLLIEVVIYHRAPMMCKIEAMDIIEKFY